MDYEDCSSSSSSSSSSLPTTPSPKRKAGRKKFRETRHPVYRGVRKRGKAGKWVCEVREPNKKTRIWLGTYPTPDMAARAHDVAAIALRGKSADLNFADSAWLLPRAESAKADDIRRAAANAAEMFSPDNTAAAAQKSRSQSSPSPPPQQQLTLSDSGKSAMEVFVDEDAMLDMPGLLRDMAEGMMLTPPANQLTGFDWDEVECHMDMSLWSV